MSEKLSLIIAAIGLLIIGVAGGWWWRGNASANIERTPTVAAIPTEQPAENSSPGTLSFSREATSSGFRLSVAVPESQSACIWTETSSEYATGANIVTTESIKPEGNSVAYDASFNGTVAATCQDKYGGLYRVTPITLGN